MELAFFYLLVKFRLLKSWIRFLSWHSAGGVGLILHQISFLQIGSELYHYDIRNCLDEVLVSNVGAKYLLLKGV